MSDDLRTDHDIARLFADANPIANRSSATDGRRRPALERDQEASGELEIEIGLEDPTEPAATRDHPRRWWLLAAAAVGLIVSLAITTWGGSDEVSVDDTGLISTRITTPDTLAPTRQSIVSAFMAALTAYDGAAMRRVLAPGFVPALIPGVEHAGTGTVGLDDQLAWLSAVGATSETENCREHGDTGLYCTVRRRDRLADLVPSVMHGTMLYGFEDGLIDGVVATADLDAYRTDALMPFYEWVLQNHPDDVERLWSRPSSVSAGVIPIVTTDAAELLDQRLTEYVAERTTGAGTAG